MISHYLTMILISLISGVLSGMWVWADKPTDIRLSMNDLYMVVLMTSFMIFFMALLNKDYAWLVGAAIVAGLTLYAIRTQAFVNRLHYFQGMIPHHSMAVLTSKRLLTNHSHELSEDEKMFVKQIVDTQEREIAWMKSRAQT